MSGPVDWRDCPDVRIASVRTSGAVSFKVWGAKYYFCRYW